MKPHRAQTTERAAVAAVRTHLRAHLGWLRGFPVEGGTRAPLNWMTMPPLGRHAQHTTLEVTRDLLRGTEYSRNTARRKFPRALALVVGDVDVWSARIDAQLELLKAVVHSAAPLPGLRALLEAACVRRSTAMQAMSLVEQHPALAPAVTALAWMHWHDEAELVGALDVVRDHGSALVNLLKRLEGLDGLVFVQRCIQLLAEGGDPALVAYLADVRIWEIPLSHGDLPAQLENTVRRFRKGREFDRRVIVEGFPRPTARLGSDLTASIERVVTLSKSARTRQLELLSNLLPRGDLDKWEQWWRRVDLLERKTRSLLSEQRENRLPREVAKQCQLFEEEIRAEFAAPPVFKLGNITEHAEIICAGASPDAFAAFLGCLRLLAGEQKGKSTKEIFIEEWATAFRGSPKRLGVTEQLLNAQHELLQQVATCAPAREAWVCRQVTKHFVDEWIEETKPQSLIEPVAAALRALIANATAWEDSSGPFADYSGWDTLIVAVEATGDGAHSAEMLSAVPPVRNGLNGRQWGILLQLSGQSAQRFQAVAAGWREEHWPEASITELALLVKQPAVVEMAAEALASGDGRRLSRVVAQSSLNRVLGASDDTEAAWMLPEVALATTLDLRPYPEELHAVLEKLGRCDPNAAQAADAVLSDAFPRPARVTEELTRLRELITNAEGARKTALQARIRNLEARLVTPSRVSPQRLGKYRAKLERRSQFARLLNWERYIGTQLRDRLAAKIGVTCPDDWMQSEDIMTVLNALAELPPGFKDLAFLLLRTRCGPAPWDLRDEAPNRAFLDALGRRGVNAIPWLDGIGPRELRTEARALILDLENDPLQIMRMGAPFDTCLAPGSFNFFSAVSNAADINKRIVYARDENGVIHGRCLLALTDDGELITFNVYAHADRQAIRNAVAAYVRELANAMGAVLAANGQIRELISTRWYDDGAVDLTGQLEFLRPESEFVKALANLPADDFIPQLQRFLGSRSIPPSVLHALAHQEAFRQRPELAVPLIPHIRAATSLYDWARLSLADMFRQAGQPDIALEIMEPWTRALPREGWEVSVAELLIKLGHPQRALRLIRQTREAWVRDWSDEWRGRVLVAADALTALRRPKQALELYRIAAKAGDRDAATRAAELERQLA